MVINFGWVSIILKNGEKISPLVTGTPASINSLYCSGPRIVSCSTTGRFTFSESKTGSNIVCTTIKKY